MLPWVRIDPRKLCENRFTIGTIKILFSIKFGICEAHKRNTKEENKAKVYIYDICDVWSEYFSKYVKRRKKVYKEEKFKIVEEKMDDYIQKGVL